MKELREVLGVSRDGWYKYMNGNGRMNVVDRIGKVLDVDVRSVINGRKGKELCG